MAEAGVSPERSAIGQRLIDDLRERGIECYAAFWAVVPTDGSLRLYLVTPAVDRQGPRQLLKQTDQILRRLNGHAGIELFDIEFQSPSDPAIMRLASSFDISAPGNRISRSLINGMMIDDMWPYFIQGDLMTGDDDKRQLPDE